jgi:hypothetical protein
MANLAMQQHAVNKVGTLHVKFVKILKLLKVFKNNIFMDDQYHWVVCLPFISFMCCPEWRGLLTVFHSG